MRLCVECEMITVELWRNVILMQAETLWQGMGIITDYRINTMKPVLR